MLALFPAQCSKPALKTVPLVAVTELHSELPAQFHFKVMGLPVSLHIENWWVPGRIRRNITMLDMILNSPNQIFFCILFCVWSMASLTSAAAEKFQHAYKSCTKNKSNVKLLTASERIGLSDSAITTWELFDRKRESIQFSRVEHHPLAICYLAKFCLIRYTLSHFWDQWSGNRSYGVFNHVQFLELSVLITEWILSWKTTCINMRSTEVLILDNALINWHVFCLFFKNRSKSPYLTLSCHSQGLPGSSWSL